MRRLLSLGLLGAAAIGLGACEGDPANTFTPDGAPVYGTLLSIAATNIPRGSVRFPKPVTAQSATADTIRVTLRGLDSLNDASYVIWLADSNGVKFTKATGTLRVVKTDTVINALGDPVAQSDSVNLPGTTSFKNGGSGRRMEFFTTRALSGLLATDSVQLVVVSIESNAAVTTPSATRSPLWSRRIEGTDTTPTTATRRYRGTVMRWGNFTVSTDSAYLFPVVGRGRVYIRAGEIVVNDSSLARPPLGYYYATFALKRNAANDPTDTIFIGELRSPYPRREISLMHADSIVVDPLVQVNVLQTKPPGSWANAAPLDILAASNRATTVTIPALDDTAGPFRTVANVYVTMESKHAFSGRMGPAIIFRANVPDIVRSGPR